MFRPLLPLLPALALCLPALAGVPGGFRLGEKEKDVHKKVEASAEFTPLNGRAKSRLESNFRLTEKLAGQAWVARFTVDRRSKTVTDCVFIGEKAMRPNQYDSLLKPFYVFASEHLREHFKLQDPLNTPEFGHASGLKPEVMFPLHAYPGEGIMLTTGLWKDKEGGIHLCFTVQPSVNSALGNTYTTNTSGKQADWTDIPAFASLDEGKAYLEAAGLAVAPPPPTPEEVEEPEEEDDSSLAVEEVPEEPTMPVASTDLPQAEQDVLNALILFDHGQRKEGLAKLITAAQAGNARALYELGRGYAEGKYTLSPNRELADNAFRKSATAGFALALVRYGAEFPLALGKLGFTAEDGQKMVQAAEKAETSSPSGRFNHAMMLRFGYGVRKDVERAAEMMQQLASENDPVAARYVEAWAP